MIPQFSTVALTSFHLWLDNWLQQQGRAYSTTTTRLFYQPDTSLPPGYVAYAAPFRSWVYNSGITGAQVLSTVSGTTGPISRGQSGMIVDYPNGRVLLSSAVGTNAVISGAYSFPDFNVYSPNATQQRMTFTDKYYLNSRFGNPLTGVPPPYDIVTPGIFVTNAVTDNEPWAFGGLYNTQLTITLNVLAETPNQLEGAISLVTDALDVCFPQVPVTAWPLNQNGDCKGGTGYNYQTVIGQYGAGNNLFTITDVRGSKVSDYAKIDEAIWLGIIDVTVERARTLR